MVTETQLFAFLDIMSVKVLSKSWTLHKGEVGCYKYLLWIENIEGHEYVFVPSSRRILRTTQQVQGIQD